MPLLGHYAHAFLPERAPHWSAHKRLDRRQHKWLIAFLLSGLLFFLIAPKTTGLALIFFFQLYFLAILIFKFWLIAKSTQTDNVFQHAEPPVRPEHQLPIITILVPLYKEQNAIPHLRKALDQLDYPLNKLDIKLLLEDDDKDTIALVRTNFTQARHDIILIPPIGPRTKPKACNYGLWSARGQYIVIYDAEDRPETDQLKKAVIAFDHAGPQLGCVQARLNYYNRKQNWLTRLEAIEYALLFDFLLPGLTAANAPIPLGGTSNFFRTDLLVRLGGWDAYNVTEDADLGLRLARAGYRTVMINATTWEEAIASPTAWLRQRSRWIKGYLQTWLVHMRQHPKRSGARNWLMASIQHIFIAGVVITGLFNPIFWAVFLLAITGMIETKDFLPPPLASLAIFCFLVGNFFHLYLFIAAPMRRRWYGLLFYGLLAPLYWVMQSIGAWMALYQFFTKPFYWEKTEHFLAEIPPDDPARQFADQGPLT